MKPWICPRCGQVWSPLRSCCDCKPFTVAATTQPITTPKITYTLIESLRTGKSWQGGMPDSNSFHEGAKAMAIHLGYEVESHAKETE